ncbi:MAG: response regulator [Candidatus Abyssobacteria bacterium SURF_5]|uniref:histidine kinase n=1 Tax=Abyssobacteria bacterium (strain SURF_5) TaxID=2093360 RepID=A0A3A4NKE8_ABYX5|nr:MAG: response regulator [Candidatus Abyssubacteria bacterium SURF_5]
MKFLFPKTLSKLTLNDSLLGTFVSRGKASLCGGYRTLEKVWKRLELHRMKVRPAWLSFLKKAFLASACILFAAGVLLWTQRNVYKFERETVARVNQYMFGIAGEKAQCIEQFVRDMQDYLSLLARKPFSGEFKSGKPLAYYDYVASEALLDHVGGRVDSIYRLDKTGKVLHRVPYLKSDIGKDWSQMPEVQYVLDKREPHVSQVLELSAGEPGFYLYHPVFDEKNFLGILCISIPLACLNESACRVQTGAADSTWIIDTQGIVISHSNTDHIGKNIIDIESGNFEKSDGKDFQDLVQKMINGEEGFGTYYAVGAGGKPEKVRKAVAFLPIRLHDQPWSLAMTTDYEQIAAPVRKNTRNNFLVASLLMLIGAVAGLIFYRNQKRKAELEVIARSAEELRISNLKLIHEIEQRNQAEKAREESESNYRLLAENVLDIIWIADLDFRFTYISPSVKPVLGLDPQEVIGQIVEKILPLCPLKAIKEMLPNEAESDVLDQKKTRIRTVDAELYRKDGSSIWAETKISFLHNSQGALAGLMGVTRDITEKKQLQQQFLQAQKMESIGTLAGGIAHDFNNLLGGILGYASLLKSRIGSAHEVYPYADTIEKSASRAAELTAQLLAFARGGKYEPKVVSINDIVNETLEIIGRTFDKLIQIKIHLDEEIPTVEADVGQIQQVLVNLCVNARDAMPGGGTLAIKTKRDLMAPEHTAKRPAKKSIPSVVLSVSDSGCGMDAATIERIFEPFFTTKEKGKGTGLGLSMVYGVIKNHGGHVRVRSKLGKGSCFEIHLPASGKELTSTASAPQEVRGGKELILVVDDEEVVRSLAKDVLESYGYKVLLAQDGVEAVEMFREHDGSIGLVIIDMVMPKMGGRETFQRLKEINPGVKALLSTGYGRNGETREIMRDGVKGLLQKPFHLEELLLKVRKVLDA